VAEGDGVAGSRRAFRPEIAQQRSSSHRGVARADALGRALGDDAADRALLEVGRLAHAAMDLEPLDVFLSRRQRAPKPSSCG